MRVCVVYDCLYPWTVGGAERWERYLAEGLAGAGHEVTYLTRRQWDKGSEPEIPGVMVVAVCAGTPLYTRAGRRRIGPPLRFGLGVGLHMARHRRRYDVVHTVSFPYIPVIAARLVLLGTATRLSVDWFEVWSKAYWRSYLGPLGGRVGWAIQSICARLSPTAWVFSDLHAVRLEDSGLRGRPFRLSGLYTGPDAAEPTPRSDPPVVVFAGRHIREKGVASVPAIVAEARRVIPDLRAVILGDGPERPATVAEVRRLGLADVVELPGFVPADAVRAKLGRAACLLLPSVREGYGLVVLEAASLGTPSVVVAGPDNAATELVHEGVNGAVASSGDVAVVADAVVSVILGATELRARTAAWFSEQAPTLAAAGSVDAILGWIEQR